MKTQIRFGTFETNSSSTHSLVILNEQEYSDFVTGKTKYDRYGEVIDGTEYDKLYETELSNAEAKFKMNASDCKYYKDAEEMARWETMRHFDSYGMDVIHEEREINGVRVHALSIYGEDY